MGLLLPGKVAQATAASRSSAGGVLVTRVTSAKVLLPPTGRLAVQDTSPPAAAP
jgi:hypothetical protein